MKAANFIMGSKTTRACDSCPRRQARWFCAADDAFLCHGCDNLVHSANQLASRHERVRLQTSASKVNFSVTTNKPAPPKAWHSGFARKARTTRHNNKHLLARQRRPKDGDEEMVLFDFDNTNTLLPVVPELESESDHVLEESDEQLPCRVPVFDLFETHKPRNNIYGEVRDERLNQTAMKEGIVADLDNLSDEILPLDMDINEFAADVESLLGSGLDEDFAVEMKGSEMFDCKEEEEEDGVESVDTNLGAKGAMVKVKDEEVDQGVPGYHWDSIIDKSSDAFNWNMDSITAVQEGKEKVVVPVAAANNSVGKVGTKRKICLKLNYEDVISAWASQGSPWTTGNPPEFNISHDCWPDFLGWSGAEVEWCNNGEAGNLRRQIVIGRNRDSGREARVSRYREKRRTRLFAKKIRYQVRKLNAEKRPRMNGRFVKTTPLLGSTTTAFTCH